MRDPGIRGDITPLHRDGSDETVAITDVDCTPRPRYRESQADFDARMGALGREQQALKTSLNKKNRVSALRGFEGADGVKQYFTRCACGWCGLRVTDPEMARRAYDAHACELDAVEIGVNLHAKPGGLPANWAAETKAQIEEQQLEKALETLPAPMGEVQLASTAQDDRESQDIADLLELK